VVFIDRMLRGVESFGYLPEVTRDRPDLHIVVLSSALSEDDERRARSSGAAAAVEKPGTLALWRALVTRVLGEAEAGADAGEASRAG
jgi:DNA-binding response OmpR family regulator